MSRLRVRRKVGPAAVLVAGTRWQSESPSKFGKLSVQQSPKGKSIQWGAYPNQTYSGAWYAVTVRLDGRKIDAKES